MPVSLAERHPRTCQSGWGEGLTGHMPGTHPLTVAPTGPGAGRGGRGGNRKASIQITDNTGSEV